MKPAMKWWHVHQGKEPLDVDKRHIEYECPKRETISWRLTWHKKKARARLPHPALKGLYPLGMALSGVSRVPTGHS